MSEFVLFKNHVYAGTAGHLKITEFICAMRCGPAVTQVCVAVHDRQFAALVTHWDHISEARTCCRKQSSVYVKGIRSRSVMEHAHDDNDNDNNDDVEEEEEDEEQEEDGEKDHDHHHDDDKNNVNVASQ